ncbi:hypothetical protein [Chitinolyticbacter meiyuanensis]|nr:hypothetical protein [Chitinolyticbacter meiyuanensis]
MLFVTFISRREGHASAAGWMNGARPHMGVHDGKSPLGNFHLADHVLADI